MKKNRRNVVLTLMLFGFLSSTVGFNLNQNIVFDYLFISSHKPV